MCRLGPHKKRHWGYRKEWSEQDGKANNSDRINGKGLVQEGEQQRKTVKLIMDWLEGYKFIKRQGVVDGQPLKRLTVYHSEQVSEQRGGGRQKHRG